MRPTQRLAAFLIAPVLLCAGGLLGACGTGSGASAGGEANFIAGTGAVTIIPPAERGDPVELSGPLVGGSGRYDLSEDRGKVVLINVWGSWCAPCRKEAPALQQAWATFEAGDEVQFLGLNTRDVAAAARAFERNFAVTYPSLSDPDGALQLRFRTTLPPRAIPSTLVLDRQGRVAARIVGPGTKSTFTGLVDEIRSET